MSDVSVSELLLAARRRPERFGDVFDRMWHPLVRWLTAHVGCPQIAADLTSEALASALTHLRSFDPARGSGEMWLWGIARNELRSWQRRGLVEDRYRKKLRIPTVELDEAAEADARVDAWAQLPALVEAMSALGDDDREVIRLRVIEELAYAEIAARLGISVEAARVRASRALARLRAAVDATDASAVHARHERREGLR